MSDQIVLECQGLTKIYQDGVSRVEVLRKLNFSLSKSETVAIMGASGSGKSTLLHLLGGLDTPSAGEVCVAGELLSEASEARKSQLRNQHMGFVYQFHHLLPEMDALENVCFPLLVGGESVNKASQIARAMLDEVGMSHRLKHRVSELSGGERQRVALARALVTKPLCVLADEPTGNLDEKTAESVLELLLGINKRLQTAFLIVTHDQSIAKRFGAQMVLHDGQLVKK